MGWQRLPTRPERGAGVLTLFIPLGFACTLIAIRSFRQGEKRRFGTLLLSFLATGVLCFALFLTQSRDGWLSSGVGMVVVLAMLGRRGLLPAGVLLILVFAAVFSIGSGRLADALLFAGKHTGLTIDSVLTFRIGIWEAAGFTIRDVFPLGIGFGVFGRALPVMYPYASPGSTVAIADAHNLFLQTILDFGIGGFIVFLFLLGAALRMSLRAARERGLFEYQNIGLFAGLASFLLFNMFDAVAIGSRAGAFWWMYLGLIFVASRTHHTSNPGQMNSRTFIWISVAMAFLIGGACLLPQVRSGFPMQHATLSTARALLSNPASLQQAKEDASIAMARNSRAAWLLGLLCEREGDEAARNAAWTVLVSAHEEYIPMVRSHAPSTHALAVRAFRAHPENPSAHFWLADIVAPTDTSRAVFLYRQGLRFAPSDGHAWIRLGTLLGMSDPTAAVMAFGEACRHGDPGANGCYLAGRISERSGKYTEAIRWYRLSRWSVARALADSLQRRLALHPEEGRAIQ